MRDVQLNCTRCGDVNTVKFALVFFKKKGQKGELHKKIFLICFARTFHFSSYIKKRQVWYMGAETNQCSPLEQMN